MAATAYTFGPFRLDPGDRRLTRDGDSVEVSARYLDALILLVREDGRLVTKDRFMEEVWRGIPVTDEALTQCIRALRRALGDDASAPRYIETVPRHGYRLIATVDTSAPEAKANIPPGTSHPAVSIALDSFAAAIGGGVAGIAGGLAYLALGLIAPGIGTASTLLVLISVNLLLGLIGGAAVGAGASLGERFAGRTNWSSALGGAAGGLLVGAIGKMLGHDLFELFFGRDPGATTGAMEGLLLGAATGFALGFAARGARSGAACRIVPAIACGLASGVLIAVSGGRLMAGSLAEMAASFPESNLHIWQLDLDPIALTIATACEAALFTACVSGAVLVGRRLRKPG